MKRAAFAVGLAVVAATTPGEAQLSSEDYPAVMHGGNRDASNGNSIIQAQCSPVDGARNKIRCSFSQVLISKKTTASRVLAEFSEHDAYLKTPKGRAEFATGCRAQSEWQQVVAE